MNKTSQVKHTPPPESFQTLDKEINLRFILLQHDGHPEFFLPAK